MKTFPKLVLGLLVTFASVSAFADYTIDRGAIREWRPQDIVITFGQDPVENTEQACLALTLAQFLRDSNPFVNVTVFLTNDGVALADQTTVLSATEYCQTPGGPISLQDNLLAFINNNPNNLVNCPICWGTRFGMQIPDYGVLPLPGTPDESAIPRLLLGADKVIDFGSENLAIE